MSQWEIFYVILRLVQPAWIYGAWIDLIPVIRNKSFGFEYNSLKVNNGDLWRNPFTLMSVVAYREYVLPTYYIGLCTLIVENQISQLLHSFGLLSRLSRHSCSCIHSAQTSTSHSISFFSWVNNFPVHVHAVEFINSIVCTLYIEVINICCACRNVKLQFVSLPLNCCYY